MVKFNDEQYEFLEKYERTFLTSINEHYFRNIGSVALNKMADIYQEVTGKPYGNRNWGCGACALTFLCTIGKMFLDEQKERMLTEVIVDKDPAIEIVPSTFDKLLELTPEGEVILEAEGELLGKTLKKTPKKKTAPKKKKETK